MKLATAMLFSTALLLREPFVRAEPPEAAGASLSIDAVLLRTGSQRYTWVAGVQAGKEEACRKLFAAFPEEVAALYRAARHRNMSCYLGMLGGKTYLVTYFEYAGHDYASDAARLAEKEAMKNWHKALAGVLVSPPPVQGWENVEEVFYTEGAAEVVPTPGKYTRTGMITGLKREKEADYRALHAAPWPGVLKGIRDSHIRNFTIRLIELDGSLYLIGYLEYVGKDPVADATAAKEVPVNKRWWKFTDACQQPFPGAAAKGEIWEGLEEIHHLD